jgi:3-hydroxybutyryl-CoA dehydratase
MTQRDFVITQEIIDAYGELNGDDDILHYDAEYAAQRGFRGTLAHGLMIQGYANVVAVDTYGDDWFTRGEIAVKFVGPTCPGDVVTVSIDDDGTLEARVPTGVSLVGTAVLRPESTG